MLSSAVALAAAVSSFLAPAPSTGDLPAQQAATFRSAWTKALASTPACKSARQVQAPAKQTFADCKSSLACFARGAASQGADFLLDARLQQNLASVSLSVLVVQANPPRLVLHAKAQPTSDVQGLVAQLPLLAAQACAALGGAPASAPVVASDDLELELDLDVTPVKKPDDDELEIALDLPQKPQIQKGAAPPPPAPAPVVAVVAPPPPAPVVEPAPIETLAFPDAPPPLVPLADEPAPTPNRGLRMGAWAAVGVAALSSGGGAFFGWRTLSAASARDGALDAPAFFAHQSEAERWGLGANVAWGVAATSAVTAGVLWWMSHGAEQ